MPKIRTLFCLVDIKKPKQRGLLAFKKTNQNTQKVKKKTTLFNLDQTKQCANLRHTLPTTKRQTEKTDIKYEKE